jgi:hypothetical protein
MGRWSAAGVAVCAALGACTLDFSNLSGGDAGVDGGWVTSILLPLYIYPSTGAWAPVIDGRRSHPDVPVVAIINPDNGPGRGVDPNYVAGLATLSAAGVRLIGYVDTGYGIRDAGVIVAEVREWQKYTGVDGIFFDRVSNSPSAFDDYRELAGSAADAGYRFLVQNPGAVTTVDYAGLFDVSVVFEGSGYPASASLSVARVGLSRSKFGSLSYGVPFDREAVAALKSQVGHLYVTDDDGGTNGMPWGTFPSYYPELLNSLAP